ncbi:MAG: hypothetical protein ACI90V_006307 [Bacillariaceae sp.]|jgi:hypothetical protein
MLYDVAPIRLIGIDTNSQILDYARVGSNCGVVTHTVLKCIFYLTPNVQRVPLLQLYQSKDEKYQIRHAIKRTKRKKASLFGAGVIL